MQLLLWVFAPVSSKQMKYQTKQCNGAKELSPTKFMRENKWTGMKIHLNTIFRDTQKLNKFIEFF